MKAPLLVLLLISIPLNTSIALAQLSAISVEGQAGIQDYVEAQDTAHFTVTASIPGDTEITPNQIRLGPSPFTSCQPGLNGYQCSLDFPSTFTQGTTAYQIKLYNDNGIEFDNFIGELYLDNAPPTITTFNLVPAVSATGTIQLSYSLIDTAASGSSPTSCSGLSSLNVSVNGQLSTTIPLSGDCTITAQTPYSSTLTNGTEEICIQAQDAFGQSSLPSCMTLQVMTSATSNDPNQFTLLDAEGIPLSTLGPSPLQVTIVNYIVSDSLNPNTVTADLSSLNPSATFITGNCAETTPFTWRCTYPVTAQLTQTNQYSMFISYTTATGSQTQTATNQLTYDATGPIVTSLTVNTNNIFTASHNRIVAAITETGAGLSTQQVRLHLSGSSGGIPATSCTPGWICTWEGVQTPAGNDVTVSIQTDTTDRLGNTATPFSQTYSVDNVPPLINAVHLTNLGGQQAAAPGFPLAGETLKVELEILDDNMDFITLDISDFGGTNITGGCTSQGADVYSCEASFPIITPGYYIGQLHITAKDSAGNTQSQTQAVSIYSLDTSQNPSNWDHTVQCSPSRLDRSISSLTQLQSYCSVNLQSGNNAQTASITTPGCIDAANSNSIALVDDIELLNTQPGSTNPVIKFLFEPAEFNINAIQLNCSIEIRSAVGNSVTEQIEVEQIPVTIPLYNQPLGTIDDNVQEKIDDAKEFATGTLMDIIGILRTIFEYAELLCNVYYTVANVVGFFKSVGDLISGAEELASAFPPLKAGILGARQQYNIGTEYARADTLGLAEYVEPFCKFVNCQFSPANEDEESVASNDWSGGVFRTIGGGTQIFGDVVGPLGGDFITQFSGKHPSEYMNSKDSLVLSVLTVCVPGIIYNLDKYRQIKCQYAKCLQDNPKTGVPIAACDAQQEYATCKYLVGEVFKIVPFTALFDYYTGILKHALSDPMGLVGIALGYVCLPEAESPMTWAYSWCAGVELASQLGQIITDVTGIIDGEWQIQDDVCDELEEDS